MQNVTRRLLALLLILILLPAVLFSTTAQAEEQPPAPKYLERTNLSYADGTTGIIYSDEMLLEDSYALSGDLAKVAVALSGAAYDVNHIRSMMREIGYDDCKTYDYEDAGDADAPRSPRSLDDNDRVAYAIGSKDYCGKRLYLVVIRGTAELEVADDAADEA